MFVTDIDECSDGSNTCSTHATCTDTIGSYTCKCPDKGFKGDGHECTGTKQKKYFPTPVFLLSVCKY